MRWLFFVFFFSSRRRHTRSYGDWSSDVCSSDLGTSVRAGHGFAVTVAGSDVWTADYERAELVRIRDQHIVGLPRAVFPFWLAPGPAGKILVASEGGDEDKDEGAVFAFDPSKDTFD